MVDELKQFVLGNADKVEVVKKICYLGDVMEKGAVQKNLLEPE